MRGIGEVKQHRQFIGMSKMTKEILKFPKGSKREAKKSLTEKGE